MGGGGGGGGGMLRSVSILKITLQLTTFLKSLSAILKHRESPK